MKINMEKSKINSLFPPRLPNLFPCWHCHLQPLMIPLSPPLSFKTCHPLSTALSPCTTIPKRKFIKREERAHLKYMGT